MPAWIPILSIALLTVLVLWWIRKSYSRWKRPQGPMPEKQRNILEAEIGFYQSLIQGSQA